MKHPDADAVRWFRGAAVATLGLFAQGVWAAGQPAACKRIALDPPPAWSNSAAWSPDGGDLAIVDVFGGNLLRYSEGKYFGSVARPGMRELKHLARLTAIPGGYLAESPEGTVTWLDRRFKTLKSVDFLEVKKSSHIEREITPFAFFDIALAGQSLLGVAIVHLNDQPWMGWVRVALKPFELREMIEEIDHNAPEDRFFRLQGYDVVPAAAGHYVLRYAQPTFLLQLSPEKRRLKAFPPGFAELPKLPEGVGGMEGGVLLYKALEHSTVAVRLYGRGDFLYLLTRRPAAQGTLWQLWQIDPRRDAVIRPLTLPTTANHVFLAPGPKDWAVIEKGPVVDVGQQAIRSMLLIPSPWIEDPASKALADGQPVSCR